VRRVAQVLVLLPRNVCVALLRAYRAVVSPLYGDVCRYYPSCSRYALEAIQQHGAVKGIALGSWRLARCHPWATGGIDDVPAPHHHRYAVATSGFVTPRLAHVHSHGKA
jgi:putative membrane protein insertion efficiency factor